LNDYIDVFVQDYENETVYVGDDVEVEIFALEVVENDDGIVVENVPSEVEACEEAWVDCDEAALAWV